MRNGRKSNQSLFCIFDKVIKTEALARPLRGPRRVRVCGQPCLLGGSPQAGGAQGECFREGGVWGGPPFIFFFFF